MVVIPAERWEETGMPVNERALRRRALAAAGALALTGLLGAFAPHARAAADGAPAASSAAAGSRAHVRLPEPTGPFPVGTTTRHLVDTSREDPWHPGRGHREVMIGLWYPAAHAGWRTAPRTAPHMERRAAAHFGSPGGSGHLGYRVPAGAVDWAATATHARVDAPAARGTGVRPVVLYSAGLGDPRTWNTSLVEDLASRGYVVVTVDHTYDSSEVALPGGRLAPSVLPGLAAKRGTNPGKVLRKAMKARVDDTRFVLDRLGDRQHRLALPHGLAAAMDLRHVGMVGQSAGGFTAVQAMHDDRRIRAAVNMDGTMEFPGPKGMSSASRDGVDRPFLLMGTDAADSGEYGRQPSWKALWQHSRGSGGWRGDVTLTGSEHGAYTDAAALLPQLARRGVVPWGTVRGDVGSVRGERAVAVTRAYVASFLDRFLRGQNDGLLDRPSSRFPEVRYAR
ncbi:alpha/beta hydrolase family protein [Streptomyces hesseae]|uniref:Esterase n=1 Tax=Streptomyces hesseae TaxID=3075519 RepID=A0ABU2SIP6_9ACTN|nr:esterase [Streptomyces sp. DSM 40473]MDT0448653.1 esterase [Streptomyces sp. DSM 40473]